MNIDALIQSPTQILDREYRNLLRQELSESRQFTDHFLYEIPFEYFKKQADLCNNIKMDTGYIGDELKFKVSTLRPIKPKAKINKNPSIDDCIEYLASLNRKKLEVVTESNVYYLFSLNTAVEFEDSSLEEFCVYTHINYKASRFKAALEIEQKVSEFLLRYFTTPLNLRCDFIENPNSTLELIFTYDDCSTENKEVLQHFVKSALEGFIMNTLSLEFKKEESIGSAANFAKLVYTINLN
jgi:hypothetical protein